MGGSGAGRLTVAGSGISGTVYGATGGAETNTLTLAQLPTGITSTGTFALSVSNILNSLTNILSTFSTGTGGATTWLAFAPSTTSSVSSPTASGTVTSNNTSGSAHANVQPTIVCNYIMRII
jgi:microcystin-dependent protein